EESDRARVIVVACWIEEFLKVKLMNEFSKGNADARKALFSENGPFATFSAKINATFCAGWIDGDVYHDIQVIRKLRNGFAHSYNPVSLDEEETRKLIQSLRVPHRQFYDWGQLRAASTADGIVIYTGDKPSQAREELHIPGAATFRMALPIVLAVLASNLGLPFATDEEGTIAMIELPKHMDRANKHLGT
ncbi:MAG TPA: hypothetical protein VF618_03150, partial [Thermoanaerobaculia bacterium]